MTLNSVESGRDQHHVRGELGCNGHHHGPGGWVRPQGPPGHRDPQDTGTSPGQRDIPGTRGTAGHREPPGAQETPPRHSPPGRPPEGGQILHVPDGGVHAAGPGDVDVVAHSHPAAHLGTATSDPSAAARVGDTGGRGSPPQPPIPPRAPRCPGRSCRRRSGAGRRRGRRGHCRRLVGSHSRGGCPASASSVTDPPPVLQAPCHLGGPVPLPGGPLPSPR